MLGIIFIYCLIQFFDRKCIQGNNKNKMGKKITLKLNVDWAYSIFNVLKFYSTV